MDDSSNELDKLTRARFKGQDEFIPIVHISALVDKVTTLAFIFGVVLGIILASLLHKFIAHPLGW